MYLIWHNSMVIMAQVKFGVCKAMDDKNDKEGVVQWITRRISGSGAEPSANQFPLKQGTPYLSLNVTATRQTVGHVANRQNLFILQALVSNSLFEIPTTGSDECASSKEKVQCEGRLL
jgi:hypothetical protein